MPPQYLYPMSTQNYSLINKKPVERRFILNILDQENVKGDFNKDKT